MQTAASLEKGAPTFADSPVPVIDIAPYFSGDAAAKRAVAAQIDEACRTIGFLVISGHGIDPALASELQELSRAFFDLPDEAKRRSLPPPGVFRGFTPMGTTALSRTIGDESPPDYREVFTMNRPEIDPADPYYASARGQAIFRPNIYPDRDLPALRPVLDRYYAAMTDLATIMMRLFALGLGLDEHWFDDKIDKHMTNLSLSDYPDQKNAPAPGQLRAGAHTDYGSMTILRTEDKPGGLEVRTRDGRWAPVPIVAGSFIINIGDLMAQWTNDRWISTMHRVVNPPRDLASGTRRTSLIFFHQPNYDARVECLPTCIGDGAHHAATTSGQHLAMKMQAMRGKALEKVADR